MRLVRQWWGAAAILGLLVATVTLSACDSSSNKAIAAPAGTTGDITIAMDRTTYGITVPFGITVTNNGKTDYYAANGRSACTFLQLQQYDPAKKTWVSIDGCQTAIQVQTLQIPGKLHNGNHPFTESFTFAPGNSPTNANAWEVGLYRIAFAYSSDSNLSKDMQAAYSPGFFVK